jgi:ketosteroid isomerase-like protein
MTIEDLQLRRQTVTLTVCILLATASGTGPIRAELSRQERARIEETARRFVSGWLRDDPEAVMATLSPGAVLMPHHGDTPVIGSENIRAFWWPQDGPATRILEFRQTYDEIDGNEHLAFVRGRFDLAFEFEAEDGTRKVKNGGNYLMLLERDGGGSWRITHRMWNDPVPQAR